MEKTPNVQDWENLKDDFLGKYLESLKISVEQFEKSPAVVLYLKLKALMNEFDGKFDATPRGSNLHKKEYESFVDALSDHPDVQSFKWAKEMLDHPDKIKKQITPVEKGKYDYLHENEDSDAGKLS